RVQPIELHNETLPWVWVIWIARGNQHVRAFTWQELIIFAVTAAALYVGVVGRGRCSWLFPKPYREVFGADRMPKSPVFIEQLCNPLVTILVDPSWIADQEQGPATVVVGDLEGRGHLKERLRPARGGWAQGPACHRPTIAIVLMDLVIIAAIPL